MNASRTAKRVRAAEGRIENPLCRRVRNLRARLKSGETFDAA
jgi:hypothetical protein